MATINLTSNTASGFLETDFNQLKSLINSKDTSDTVPQWNADRIRGIVVSDISPTDGQVFAYDLASSELKPTTLGGGGSGDVKISGTPTANQYARWTDEETIQGRSTSDVKSDLSLGNVENTAISTWVGSANITTVGTVATGTWNATIIGSTKGGTGVNNANKITISSSAPGSPSTGDIWIDIA